jgi:soluble lytic murein transglycosylase-like protein
MGLAFGINFFFQLSSAPENQGHPVSRSPYLVSNYKALSLFLSLTPGSASDSNSETTNDTGAQLLADLKKVETAEANMTEGNYNAIPRLLDKISDSFEYISMKKERIRLRYFYGQRRYQSFLKKYQEFPFEEAGMRQMFLTSLIKTGNKEEAFGVFEELFKRQKLSILRKMLPPSLFQSFVRRLNLDHWFHKFDYLLAKRRYRQFFNEQKYCKIPDLNNFFNADYNYRRRSYTRALYWLRKVKSPDLLPHKKRIITKINIRQNIYDPDSFTEEMRMIPAGSPRYGQFLLNTAGLMIVKGEYPLAIDIYDQYIALGRTADDNHWKAMWRNAWMNMKENNRTRAFSYFQSGRKSHIDAYKVASDYWFNRLSAHPQTSILEYPFSFYFARTWEYDPPEDYILARDSLRNFLQLVSGETTETFHEITQELQALVENGMTKEAHKFIKWTGKADFLNQTDRNLLKIIDSIIWLREGRLQNAFVSFRKHFTQYQRIVVPRFLRALYLPLRYEETIHRYAREQNIDPYLVMALIREESYFRKNAVSHARANGLMQLLLSTARRMARPFGVRLHRRDLYKPEINVRFGCVYFRKLIDRYDGKVHMALAAYNAGEHRVDRWKRRFWYAADDEEFIEMIPFTETRNYVKNILRNYFYYRYYYNNSKLPA